MNAPIRRLSVLVGLLFASLLVSTTLIQYVFAASLNARPDNRRTLLSAYNRDRGPILVGTTTIAQSKQTKGGEFTWLRTYPQGKDYAHITGYFSFFGAAGGLELAENSLLSGRSDKQPDASAKRIRELERELARKDKALAEAAALLVLQKKFRALMEAEDDDTEPRNGR